MKLFGLTVLAGTLAVPALACDVCAVYSAATARGEIGKGFYVGLAEQFTRFGTLQTDGMQTPSPVEQYLNSSTAQFAVGYNFNERFGVQFTAPMVHRSFQRPDDTGAIQRGTEAGVGDVSLLGHFLAINRETKHGAFRWTVLGGLKFPTGSTGRLQEEVDELTAPPAPVDSAIHGHDLTLGSGSVDGIIGTAMFTRWKRVFFSANVQYAIRSTGDFDYRFADDLSWSGGPGALLILGDNFTLALQTVVSGETKGQDTFQGNKAGDTGLTAVYVGPQISATWKEKLSAEIGVDLPVSIRNTSFQAVPDFRVRAGLTWRF